MFTIAFITRSQARQGGVGSQTVPIRYRPQSQSGVELGEASGTRPRIGTTRSETRTRNNSITVTQQDESGSEEQTHLAASASTVLKPATTKAGLPRKRMQWTSEINEFIMRTYYKVTALETDFTLYRHRLHEVFKQAYPDIQISQQRLADQKRTIITNKLITDELLQNIKEQVRQQLEPNIHSNNYENVNQNMEPNNYIENTPNETQTNEDTPLSVTLSSTLYQYLIKFEGTNPTLRPGIHRINNSKKVKEIIRHLNTSILTKYVEKCSSIEDTHLLIYAAALTVTTTLGLKPKVQLENTNYKKHKPKWQKRIEGDILNIRTELGRLTQYAKKNITPKLQKHLKKIFSKLNTHTKHEHHNQHIKEYMDTLKQKLAVKSNRLRRYKLCTIRQEQNHLFDINQKLFYQKLKTNTEGSHNILPTQQTMQQYWSSMWSQSIEHNYTATWIQKEVENAKTIPAMQYEGITTEELVESIKKTQNWKAPGVDKLHNFWYKQFTCLHQTLAKQLTKMIQNPENVPPFLTQGITYMKPKSENTQDPSQYRPITCLPTLYKILTACITNKIYAHVEINNVITEEQKGCRKKHMGCKEQLIIDSTVLQQAYKKHRNLHTAYIDYKKAFDSVPHTWLVNILKIYKVNPTIIACLQSLMQQWKTTVHLTLGNRTLKTGQIDIKRGIFQGDSLSPLWFCLALNPLSKLLNNTSCGYNIKHDRGYNYTLSHLLYMDDIKIFAPSRVKLEQLIKITLMFSKDINMEFGLNKCKITHIEKGKTTYTGLALEGIGIIDNIEEGEMYKYLGFHQAKLTEHKYIKDNLTSQYTNRLEQILKTKLNARNIIKAVNTYAIPLLSYSFGVIQWTRTDLQNIDRKTRTTLTKYRIHHPNAAIERLTMPRQQGGRGLIDITNLHNKQIQTLRNFFYHKQDTSNLHKIVCQIDQFYTPLNLHNTQYSLQIDTIQNKHNSWMQKELHGRHVFDLEQPHVDKIASNFWLKDGSLFAETEGFMIAIQDQVINTKNYKKYIQKENIQDLCRKCHSSAETIQHITSGCRMLAQTDYLHRHNQVANIIHQYLANEYKLIQIQQPYYKYQPESVLENDNYKLYYDRAIITDKTIHHNRPDITLVHKQSKAAYIIDIAIPNTHNLQTTIAGKNTKYTELAQEIKRIWNMQKVEVVPIVLSSTGVIPETLHTSLKMINVNPYIFKQLQKATILNTCRIVRSFLNTNT